MKHCQIDDLVADLLDDEFLCTLHEASFQNLRYWHVNGHHSSVLVRSRQPQIFIGPAFSSHRIGDKKFERNRSSQGCRIRRVADGHVNWVCAKPCRDSFQEHEINNFNVLIQELQDRFHVLRNATDTDHLVKDTTGHRSCLSFNIFVHAHGFCHMLH